MVVVQVGFSLACESARMNKTITLLALTCFATVASADEHEEKVAEANVPKAVRDAVTKKFPNATSRSFEKEMKGKTQQFEAEVELKDGEKTRKLSMEISLDGSVLGEEEEISFEELPSAVKTAHLASRYGKNSVESVEREVKQQKVTYEILIAAPGGKRELVYDEKGALLKEHTGR